MNGRLRRYMLRNMPIKNLTNEFLQIISSKINETPRKCLGFLTAKEVLQRDVFIKAMSHLI